MSEPRLTRGSSREASPRELTSILRTKEAEGCIRKHKRAVSWGDVTEHFVEVSCRRVEPSASRPGHFAGPADRYAGATRGSVWGQEIWKHNFLAGAFNPQSMVARGSTQAEFGQELQCLL